jgi:adenylate cyclase
VDRQLARFLRRHGATKEEIERAERDGELTLLAIDRLLVPGARALDADQVAAASGVSDEVSSRLWRALGFPDTATGAETFTDEAVDVLRLLDQRAAGSMFTAGDVDALVSQVRAVASGLARVAEALSDQVVGAIGTARALGASDEQVAAATVDAFDWAVLARLTDFALRVQLRAAILRKLVSGGDAVMATHAVGFVDLVGYTALSQELDQGELGELVGRFEALTHDTVVELGGRVVKTIGDEVMFVAEDVGVALEVALALTARTEGDDVLPLARAGVAVGPALAREGDYYGSVVNLAHRLVELARPSSVVVAAEVAEGLEGDPRFAFKRLRSRRIRDIGRVDIYVAEPARAPAAAAEPGGRPTGPRADGDR